MRTILRFQSQLLPRRSYKPARDRQVLLKVAFKPSQRIVVPVAGGVTEDDQSFGLVSSDIPPRVAEAD